MDLFKYSQDFSKLKQFYFVAKEGGLTKAAKILNLDHSSLSKAMKHLEARIKTKLFKREGSGLKLTPDGERLYEHVAKLLHENDSFLKTFHDNGDELQGEIKIRTTPAFADIELTHHLLPFLKKHPKLKLSINTTTEDFDIQSGDVAIRSFMPNRPDLEQLLLHTHHIKLWASPQYLEEFGVPKEAHDLDHHQLLVFEISKENLYRNSYWLNWIRNVGNTSGHLRKPHFQMTSHHGLYFAACQGFGIIQLAEELAKINDMPLINVLPNLEAPQVELYFTFYKNLHQPKRIKALYDYLLDCFQNDTLSP